MSQQVETIDEEVVRQRLETALQQPMSDETGTFLHRFFGFRIATGSESATVEFDYQPYLANRHGALHGGIVALVLDTAMGNLHRAALGPGVTLEMKTQYFRAVRGGSLICRAHFAKIGKQVSFLEADLFEEDLSDSSGPVAAATGTWFRSR